MRMKWKYPVYFSGLVVAIAITAVSCSEGSTAPQPSAVINNDLRFTHQKLPDLQASFNWPGKYHTEALAYVYAKLSRGNQRASKPDKCRVAVSALKEFDRSFSKDGKTRGIADSFLSDDFCNGNLSGVNQKVPADDARLEKSSGFSPQALSSFHQILNVLDSNASAAAMVAAINGIESAASRTLSAAEAGAVVSLGSVAISSAQYWDANSVKWQTMSSGGASNQLAAGFRPSAALLFAPAGSSPRQSLSGNNILRADAAAFLSSILLGWWMGAIDLEVSVVRGAIASMLAAM
jgi:hypothetical protein